MKAPSEAFERVPVKEDNVKSTMMHVSPCFINSRGEIAGLGMTSTDEFHAF
jgi:hypothetical protein